MANITLKGNAISTSGNLPEVGSKASNFSLVKGDLSKVSLDNYKGNRVVLNIFPSLDTGTCAASVRKFNEKATGLNNTKVLCISRDLPFAQNRFCGAEGIKNVETLSDFDNGQFGKDYGLQITSGPLAGLHSRAVVVLDEEGKVIYNQQVPEIVDEPDYDSALKALE
jgi:thiol peroxidase